jgi:hypothetical protein
MDSQGRFKDYAITAGLIDGNTEEFAVFAAESAGKRAG